MDPYLFIGKYYAFDSPLRRILVLHSESVTAKAVAIATSHPALHADLETVRCGALLHDIGIFLTDADGILCHGTAPYICHGVLGADLLRREADTAPLSPADRDLLLRCADICERHTGTGLTLRQIVDEGWDLPHRDLQPRTVEEEIVCFADKFFSKTRLTTERTPAQARAKLVPFGPDGLQKFDDWCQRFL